MSHKFSILLVSGSILALSACSGGSDFSKEAGAEVDAGQFGNATMQNSLIQTGEMQYTVALAERFSKEVPDTVTFAFNQATLSPEAMQVLDAQANFIRQFPEVRFKVFGHTDLVGSSGYNKSLGMKRAKAVVNYLVGKGISRSRLEAVVSYGKTRPIIQTNSPEERNRRTVTEVSGFVSNNPMVLNGKYAAIIWRTYSNDLPVREHPANSTVTTQISQ